MKRIPLKNYKAIITGGAISIGLTFLLVQLGFVVLDSDNIPKVIVVFITGICIALIWYFLAFLIIKYSLYKVLGIVGFLIIAILAEYFVHIGNNPVTIPLTIMFWIGLAYLILPQFFKKYQIAVFTIYGSVIAYYFFNFGTTLDYGADDRASFAGFMLIPIPLFGALWLYEQWRWVQLLKKDRTKAELTLLKSQVNPHFFFNTLNNLYGLVVEKSPYAPEVVLRLSDMMRYTIYEGKEELVKIENEVNYLQTYMELHKIRYQKKVDIQFTHTLEKEIMVAPLLFIILLENAFKHGVETLTDNAYIHMSLRTGANGVFFRIVNNYEPNSTNKKSGIGLENLEKRLKLIYPGQHELKIEKKDTTYVVYLNLYHC